MFSNNNNTATKQLHDALHELAYPRDLYIFKGQRDEFVNKAISQIDTAINQGADVSGLVNVQDEYNKPLGTPLHYAAMLGNQRLIQLFLEKAPQNINMLAYGETPLTIAISHERYNAARQLLRAGADPDAVRIEGDDTHDQISETPLQQATRKLEKSIETDSSLITLINYLKKSSVNNQKNSDEIKLQSEPNNTIEKQQKQRELQITREKRKKQIELQKTKERRRNELRDSTFAHQPNQLEHDQQPVNLLIDKIEKMKIKKNYHEDNQKSRSKLNVLNKTLEYLRGTQTIDDLSETLRSNPNWDSAIFSSVFNTSNVRKVVDDAIKLKGDAPIDYSNTPKP